MRVEPELEGLLRDLEKRGLEKAEVYAKRGRSRRFQHGAAGTSLVFSQEQGWAVRAGDANRSFFFAATGQPRSEFPWPAAAEGVLRLPEVGRVPPLRPSGLDAPLIGEREGSALLRGVERSLVAELPGAKLETAVLEDGFSEIELANSLQMRTHYRMRTAALRLEAQAPGGIGSTARIELAEREARRFNPVALGRRLADLLQLFQKGTSPKRDRGDILLAPEVGARLLAGLLPLFVGHEASARVAAFLDRRGRIGSEALSVVDDGRLAGGALQAPVDGEGVATRELVLVERGRFLQPLVAWWERRAADMRVSGCSRRDSWRDLPRPGPSHLFIRPQAAVRVASLLSKVARGYYLIGASGAGRFDLESDRFCVPVCGFVVEAGRPKGAVARAWLGGSIGGLLRGIQVAARDLSFLPLDGMIGSPSMLVTGLELRDSPW